MKVLHITASYPSSGASKGAIWLHKALSDIDGIESKLLIQHGDESNETYTVYADTKLKYFYMHALSQLDKMFVRRYPNRKRELFSPAKIGSGVLNHPLVAEADILHFHWMNNSFIPLKKLSGIQKPIVWTIRDMWPFTGGCHYTDGCTKFTSGCGSCPHLGSKKENDLSRDLFLRKKAQYSRNIHPVAISPWLAEQANASALFSDNPVGMIWNGIDVSAFTMSETHQARQALGLPTDKKIIVFGAVGATTDRRKGYSVLLEALTKISNPEQYHIAIFGKSDPASLAKLPITYTDFGTIADINQLSLVYSAGNVFVASSLQEAFGKTIAESLSCGTPVVAFDATGPQGMLEHLQTGYLVQPYSAEDLATGISTVCNWELDRGQALRDYAMERFDVAKVSSQYAELYSQIMRDVI